MTGKSSFDSATLAPEAARHVDDICTWFERAWKRGDRPRIEDLLEVAAEAERPALLRELIALEVELRRSRGEDPKSAEFRQRFPGQTTVVDSALTATLLWPESNRPRPTRDDSRRNHLLGLLALRIGLIDQDQLFAASRAWSRRAEGKTLAEILLERGSIDAESRSLLVAMADKQLRLHGGDTEKSLASIAAGPATVNMLAALGDTNLTGTARCCALGRRCQMPPRRCPSARQPAKASGSASCGLTPVVGWGRCSWRWTRS